MEELVGWFAFFALRNEEQEKEMERAKMGASSRSQYG